MSTFNGIVKTFPEIRIDFFRRHPESKPPSACFLSHVHSDHLQGLDSSVLPFVYCSAATKRLLLRMEKYPHRINFAKGILEARKQTYRHLKKVLKALPLQTPTVIELTPKSAIRVTLFDANHCPGAVMFLIEGDGKAILYTGDVRSEAWWVDSLIRNPNVIPYTLGERRLDCLYMDTTFATKSEIYRDFPSKASGLTELISKVSQYPLETTFYFRAWTLGYEDAWLALSSVLSSRIHVDAYQTRLYSGLLDDHGERISVQEAAALVGFAAGNHWQEGCLTDDPTVKVRIHSCEPGTACHAELSKRQNLVWITPIISRTANGTEMYEIGAGGGGGDLYQTPELDVTDPGALQALQALCVDSIQDPAVLSKALSALQATMSTGGTRISLEGLGINLDPDLAVTLHDFIALLSDLSLTSPESISNLTKLTNTIHFPFSRHSSYNELHFLASAFKPRDICPCTVDLDTWNEDLSMEVLFGEVCSEKVFAYDAVNRVIAEERRASRSNKRKRDVDDHEDTQRSADEDEEEGEDVFESAEEGRKHEKQTSILRPNTEGLVQGLMNTTTTNAPPISPQQRELNPFQEPELEHSPDTPMRRLKAIGKAFHALEHQRKTDRCDTSADINTSINLPPTEPPPRTEPSSPALPSVQAGFSAHSESNDVVAEQDAEKEDPTTGSDLDPNFSTQHSSISFPLSVFDSHSQPQSYSPAQSRSPRIHARISAYQAAKASLSGDSMAWEDLGIRSVGYDGHVEEEVEL